MLPIPIAPYFLAFTRAIFPTMTAHSLVVRWENLRQSYSPHLEPLVLDRILPGCGIGGLVGWVLCLENFGLDIRRLDDKTVITWDVGHRQSRTKMSGPYRLLHHSYLTAGALRSRHLIPTPGAHIFCVGQLRHLLRYTTTPYSPPPSQPPS